MNGTSELTRLSEKSVWYGGETVKRAAMRVEFRSASKRLALDVPLTAGFFEPVKQGGTASTCKALVNDCFITVICGVFFCRERSSRVEHPSPKRVMRVQVPPLSLMNEKFTRMPKLVFPGGREVVWCGY